MDGDKPDRLRELVAGVAAAYFTYTRVNASEIPDVVQQIATSLTGAGVQAEPAALEMSQERAKPGQIRKSVTPDAIVSFEDGRAYKSLKRHLSVRGLTPRDYRQKWGLPSDYPMVAPSYSATRSSMAKARGFGRKGGALVADAPSKDAAKPRRTRKSPTPPVGDET